MKDRLITKVMNWAKNGEVTKIEEEITNGRKRALKSKEYDEAFLQDTISKAVKEWMNENLLVRKTEHQYANGYHFEWDKTSKAYFELKHLLASALRHDVKEEVKKGFEDVVYDKPPAYAGMLQEIVKDLHKLQLSD